MPIQSVQPFRVNERTTPRIKGEFLDANGNPVDALTLQTITATLYSLDDPGLAILNLRNNQDIFNTNNGVVDAPNGVFYLYMQPDDNAIIDTTLATERHRLLIRWTWDPLDGQGVRANNVVLDIHVRNLNYVP